MVTCVKMSIVRSTAVESKGCGAWRGSVRRTAGRRSPTRACSRPPSCSTPVATAPLPPATSPEQQRDVVALQVRYNRALRRCIIQGVADGSFDVEDPAISTFALLDMLDGVRQWFRPDGQLHSLDDIVGLYQQLALHMLGMTKDR